MRSIAGQRRGHKINGPRPSADTRPTSDLVRESLFNILGQLVEGRLVIDLFAGTGAIGLEALSRGAERAIFVERNRKNVGLIHRNIAALRYEARAVVRHADAYRVARSVRAIDARPIVVFLDPPYREYEVNRRKLRHMLSGLIEQLPARSAIALESGQVLDSQILPDFDSWDIRRYGSTQVAIRVSPDMGNSSPEAPDQLPCAADNHTQKPVEGDPVTAELADEAEGDQEQWDDGDEPC
jgi:16S rRNA (guanine966-N2)-methyltransferase